MHVSTIDSYQVPAINLFLEQATKRIPEGYYKVARQEDIALVEPLNAAPYVLDLKGLTRYTFPSEPRSGTDAMRKRIEATLFISRFATFEAMNREPLMGSFAVV